MTASIASHFRRVLPQGRGHTTQPTRAVNAGDGSTTTATTSPSMNLLRLAVDGAERIGYAMRNRANNWNWLLNIRMRIGSYVEPVARSTSVSGTYTLDLRYGNVFEITLSGDTTIALASFPVPSAVPVSGGFTVAINNPDGYELSWPGNVYPMDGVEDWVDTGRRQVFILWSSDNGENWDLMSSGMRDI